MQAPAKHVNFVIVTQFRFRLLAGQSKQEQSYTKLPTNYK